MKTVAMPFQFSPLHRQAYAAPRYAPPRSGPLLSQTLPPLPSSVTKMLPPALVPLEQSAVLLPALGGVAFIVGGMFLPGPIGSIATIGGLGLIGFAGYKLLTNTSAKAEAAKAAPLAPGTPAGVLAEQVSVALDPAQSRSGGTTRNMFTTQDYDLAIHNNTNKPIAVYGGLAIYDGDGKLLWQSQPEVFPTGRKAFTVDSQGALQGTLSADALPSFLPQTVSVEVQLFRNLTDKDYFMRSEGIPIKLAYLG